MKRATIIGGGLAGAAAAARLAQAGQAPLLLERETQPHDKICGEFLSAESRHALAAIGFDAGRLGGVPIDRVRLHAGRRMAEARLPFVATSITRRVLDAALLDHAAAAGAKVQRGVSVRAIADGRTLTSVGESDAGPLLLATGKHDLRGMARDRAGTIADLIGFKMFFRAPALHRALAGTVAVVLFDGGYAGLQPVEGGRLNLCLLVEQPRYKALGGNWPALLAALLAEPGLAGLAEAEPLLDKPLAISGVPYGWLARAAGDDLWRLGDQAAVIPSFCGDGMAIALHSGQLAGAMLAGGATASQFQQRLHGDVARQVRLAVAVQRLARQRHLGLAMVAGLGLLPGAIAALARWTRVTAPPALSTVASLQ
jgi:flavin-dependent dehydrogenase